MMLAGKFEKLLEIFAMTEHDIPRLTNFIWTVLTFRS